MGCSTLTEQVMLSVPLQQHTGFLPRPVNTNCCLPVQPVPFTFKLCAHVYLYSLFQ
jgi:hypothetical protein